MAQAQINHVKFSLNLAIRIPNCETVVWYSYHNSNFKITYEQSGIEISSHSFKDIVNHLLQTHQISLTDHYNVK